MNQNNQNPINTLNVSNFDNFQDKNSQDLGKYYVNVLNNMLKNQTGANTNVQNSLNNFSQINSYLNSQINSQLNKFGSFGNVYNSLNPTQNNTTIPGTPFPIQQKPETLIQNNNFNVNHNTINFNNNQNLANPNLQLLASLLANRTNNTVNASQILNSGNNFRQDKPQIDPNNAIVQHLLSNMMKKNNIPNTISQAPNTINNIVNPINNGNNLNNIPNLISLLSSKMNTQNANPQTVNPMFFQNKDMNALNLIKNNLKGFNNMYNLEDLSNIVAKSSNRTSSIPGNANLSSLPAKQHRYPVDDEMLISNPDQHGIDPQTFKVIYANLNKRDQNQKI